MGTTNHFPECWRQEDHPACRLAEIHRLQVKVLALKTQLQVERTGHLVEGDWLADAYTDLHREMSAPPCHDHIEPPIVSGGPTWAHRPDEPPSLTP